MIRIIVLLFVNLVLFLSTFAIAEEINNNKQQDNTTTVNQVDKLDKNKEENLNIEKPSDSKDKKVDNSEDFFLNDTIKETKVNDIQLAPINFSSYYITILVMLLLLGVLAYISSKLKNRGNLPKLNLPFGSLSISERKIKVIDRYILEPRKNLYIVNVSSKNWLIACSESDIKVISEVDLEENSNMENKMKSEKLKQQVNNVELEKEEKKDKSFSDYLNLPILLPICFLAITFLFSIFSIPAFAQDTGGQGFNDLIDLSAPVQLKELGTPLQLIIFMAMLTLLPFIFIMTTSFVRIIIVLGFMRQAIGTQQVPPNQVLMGISIFLTIYIMSPVWQEINQKALTPYLDHKITQAVAIDRGVKPLRNFMLKYVKKEELSFFMRVADLPQPKTAEDVPIHVLIPAYMVSELSTGFKIGFFLFLPFLVVDLVVANTLLALGMMMLSPVTISMPFKLLVFTLANGWYLVLQALVTSFKL